MNEALRIKQQEVSENEARIAMWNDMFRMEGWRILVDHLKEEYVSLGLDTPDSVKGLAARNAKMTLIRELFRFIKHDFDLREVLLKDLYITNDWDDQMPDSI